MPCMAINLLLKLPGYGGAIQILYFDENCMDLIKRNFVFNFCYNNLKRAKTLTLVLFLF